MMSSNQMYKLDHKIAKAIIYFTCVALVLAPLPSQLGEVIGITVWF